MFALQSSCFLIINPPITATMSYVTETDICENVVLERLDEPLDSSLLFDVPNPESDIDEGVSAADCDRVFKSNLAKLIVMASSIP